MFTLKITSHKEASDELLHQVIALKSVALPYPEASQLVWINENMKPDDLHCVLFEGNSPVGYVNLINERLSVLGNNTCIWGIGNVCVVRKGEGLGGVLMKEVNKFIEQTNRTGLLFCRERLVGFYGKSGWEVTPNLIQLEKDVFAMTYNLDKEAGCTYEGRLF